MVRTIPRNPHHIPGGTNLPARNAVLDSLISWAIFGYVNNQQILICAGHDQLEVIKLLPLAMKAQKNPEKVLFPELWSWLSFPEGGGKWVYYSDVKGCYLH